MKLPVNVSRMDIKSAIDRSSRLCNRLSDATENRVLPDKSGYREAAACFQLALEHHAATCLLIGNNFFGTAFAINRLIYETSICGLWLMHASVEAVENFRANIRPPAIKQMLAVVKDTVEWKGASQIGQNHTDTYDVLSDLTHAGPKHLAFRIIDMEIIPAYDAKTIVSMLEAADKHLMYAVLGWISMWPEESMQRPLNAAIAEWKTQKDSS